MIRISLAVVGMLVALAYTFMPPIVKRTPMEVVRIEIQSNKALLTLTDDQQAALDVSFKKGDDVYKFIFNQLVNRNEVLGLTLFIVSTFLLYSKPKK